MWSLVGGALVRERKVGFASRRSGKGVGCDAGKGATDDTETRRRSVRGRAMTTKDSWNLGARGQDRKEF